MAPPPQTAIAPRDQRPVLNVLWITTLTTALAVLSSGRVTDHYLRPLFFVGLLTFFVMLGRRQPGLRSLPYRLIEMGFLMLSLGALLATFLRRGSFPFVEPALAASLAFGLDRGVAFLLGFSLLSYGIVLWVPEVLESQRILREDLEETRLRSRRRAQALKRAKEVIARQEALVSVGELAAGVAHELRNPLAIVKSALQRVRTGELVGDERTRCLEIMDRAVEKANARISGLLDLGRETRHAPRTEPARDLLKLAVDLAHPQAKGHDVEIESYGATAVDEYFGDKDLLLQVLLNLIRNAIQAGPHRGPIRAGFAQLSEGRCRFVVEDRGKGIDEANRAKLFTPFFTTKDDGSGLGLTVSASLVERHGGKLWLESRTHGGTRACVELPAEAAHD